MGKPIYLTDPVVAAAYRIHPGEFVFVANDTEADWLISNHHGYGINNPTALPPAYYVHPSAPLPFVAFGTPAPSPPPAPTPGPPPAPPTPPAPETLVIGAEDQHIRIDTDGDGTTDVHVVIDRPPQGSAPAARPRKR